jgi:hypothetical protein
MMLHSVPLSVERWYSCPAYMNVQFYCRMTLNIMYRARNCDYELDVGAKVQVLTQRTTLGGRREEARRMERFGAAYTSPA